MSEPCYLAVWEFRVKPESIAEFERVYGPEGQWARLFRRSNEYLGTELLQDRECPGRYLTIDRWASHEALQRFKQEFAAKYAALDKKCERLTESEDLLGDFEAIKAEQANLKGLIGSASKSLPKDLSSNPRHFEGFGKSK